MDDETVKVHFSMEFLIACGDLTGGKPGSSDEDVGVDEDPRALPTPDLAGYLLTCLRLVCQVECVMEGSGQILLL